MYGLLCLVLYCVISPDVLAGVYQFPPSLDVRRGDTVNLSCHLNETQSYCHTVAWVRVDPMSGIMLILQHSKNPLQIKDQMENRVCQASIYNAGVEDSGTYYCIATDREHMYYGNGTKVTIQAVSTVLTPSIEIWKLASSNIHNSTVTLQCAIEGFTPSQVDLYWFIGSRKEKGQTGFFWVNDIEISSVITQNHVLVSAEEWRRTGECTCVLKFGGSTFNKTLNYHDVQEACYAVVSLARIAGMVVVLLFFIMSFTTATYH